MSDIKVGDRVRSLDFPDDIRPENKGCYVEGVVISFPLVGGCLRYAIRVERKVWAGVEVTFRPEQAIVWPPINGARIAGTNRVTNGVSKIEPEVRKEAIMDTRAWDEKHGFKPIPQVAAPHPSAIVGLDKIIDGKSFKPDASPAQPAARCAVCGSRSGVAWIGGAGQHLCYKHQDDY